ncbi:MAG: DUF4397 domain-containing protein [Lutisporaceae bacterium]
MYNQTWYPYEKQSRVAPMSSYIRVLHSSPDAPGVDIYVNENLIARDVIYKEFSPYIPIVGGLYNVKVYPTGTKINPVIDTNINIPPSSIFTIAATGRLAEIGLTLVPEPPIKRLPDETFIRFVHLSPDAPNVDITLPDGTKLFNDIEYKEIASYIPIKPGKYELQARTFGTNNVILTVPNINFKPGKIYTVYLVGLTTGKPSLQVLIPLDGSTYLQV